MVKIDKTKKWLFKEDEINKLKTWVEFWISEWQTRKESIKNVAWEIKNSWQEQWFLNSYNWTWGQDEVIAPTDFKTDLSKKWWLSNEQLAWLTKGVKSQIDQWMTREEAIAKVSKELKDSWQEKWFIDAYKWDTSQWDMWWDDETIGGKWMSWTDLDWWDIVSDEEWSVVPDETTDDDPNSINSQLKRLENIDTSNMDSNQKKIIADQIEYYKWLISKWDKLENLEIWKAADFSIYEWKANNLKAIQDEYTSFQELSRTAVEEWVEFTPEYVAKKFGWDIKKAKDFFLWVKWAAKYLELEDFVTEDITNEYDKAKDTLDTNHERNQEDYTTQIDRYKEDFDEEISRTEEAVQRAKINNEYISALKWTTYSTKWLESLNYANKLAQQSLDDLIKQKDRTLEDVQKNLVRMNDNYIKTNQDLEDQLQQNINIAQNNFLLEVQKMQTKYWEATDETYEEINKLATVFQKNVETFNTNTADKTQQNFSNYMKVRDQLFDENKYKTEQIDSAISTFSKSESQYNTTIWQLSDYAKSNNLTPLQFDWLYNTIITNTAKRLDDQYKDLGLWTVNYDKIVDWINSWKTGLQIQNEILSDPKTKELIDDEDEDEDKKTFKYLPFGDEYWTKMYKVYDNDWEYVKTVWDNWESIWWWWSFDQDIFSYKGKVNYTEQPWVTKNTTWLSYSWFESDIQSDIDRINPNSGITWKMIENIWNDYWVNPSRIAAIIRNDSSYWKNLYSKNNFGNVWNNDTLVSSWLPWVEFNSTEQGIEAVAKNLRDRSDLFRNKFNRDWSFNELITNAWNSYWWPYMTSTNWQKTTTEIQQQLDKWQQEQWEKEKNPITFNDLTDFQVYFKSWQQNYPWYINALVTKRDEEQAKFKFINKYQKYVDENWLDWLKEVENGTILPSSMVKLLTDGQWFPKLLETLERYTDDPNVSFDPILAWMRAWSPFANYDVAQLTAKSELDLAQQLIWKFLEWWKLTDADYSKYDFIVPKLKNTTQLAKNKIKNLAETLKDKADSYLTNLEAAWYDTTNLQIAWDKEWESESEIKTYKDKNWNDIKYETNKENTNIQALDDSDIKKFYKNN